MTKNQIDFANLKENIRHNVASETIGHRQADASMASAGAAYFNAQVQQEWYNRQYHQKNTELDIRQQEIDQKLIMPWIGILGQ